MRRSAALIGMALAIASAMAGAQQRTEVPTVYEAGHFYATPVLADGTRLRLLVDTGGGGGAGWFVLQRSTVARLHLATADCALDGETLHTVASLSYREGHALPASNATPCPGPALIISGWQPEGDDGQLGAGYLPRHVWTFDYPAQKLWLESANWQAAPGMHRVALGMLRTDKGEPQTGLLRIPVQVDGETIDLLLDTGATAHPTEAGKIAGTPVTANGIGVTSYITRTQLERWHRTHPDWRVVEKGDDLLPSQGATRLIEVPRLVVAGWELGPVWFTERPDANFANRPGNVGSFVDQPIQGALGANVFRHFRMTLDYPRATAWFACVSGCRVVPAP